jgi:tetrahydromethanopterin S-methyltransferase subunit H
MNLHSLASRAVTSGEGQIQNSRFKRTAANMFISREELIEEIESHIRKFGGRFGEWPIGTAKDCRGPFFQRHLVADLGDGLTDREAFRKVISYQFSVGSKGGTSLGSC